MSEIDASTENRTWQRRPQFGSGRLKISSPERKCRVLLVGASNAFADGVMNLLRQQPRLSIRRATGTEEAAILRNVSQHRPEVLVLILSRSMNLENIMILLSATQAASHLRLVVLRLDNTGIEVHEIRNAIHEIRSNRIFPVTVEDFLKLMQMDCYPGQ